MHRLLVESARLAEESPELAVDLRRHLKVLRPEADERIELFDGCGRARAYIWRDGRLVADAGSPIRTARRPRPLALFACVTKGSRWDWTIEKATELGVTRIVPVISERTIVRLARAERAAKRERWRRIAEDAARQSGALYLPEIEEAVDFAEALALVRETRCFVGALTEPPAPFIAEALRACDGEGEIAAFIGPEGDFTPHELEELGKVATKVSLGEAVLRAETAAIFAISAIIAARGLVENGSVGRPTL